MDVQVFLYRTHGIVVVLYPKANDVITALFVGM
ncbi:Uncharacterised protein [uncultured archaeon]|nr:Uncharacterised protein [uncultured archaeon]